MVVGVVCCMLPLPACFDLVLPPSWYICLPACTWLVYLTDHLIDSYRNPFISTPRHEFIRKYKNSILRLIILLMILSVYVVSKWPDSRIMITGITTGIFATVYLILAWIPNKLVSFFYNKELFVAITYATGIYLATGLSQPLHVLWLPAYLLFLTNVFINLLMVSIIEYKQERGFSWIQMIGVKRAERLFYILCLLTLFVALFLSTSAAGNLRLLLFTYSLMPVIHLLIYLKREKLFPNEKYRKLGEIIFWIPIIAWVLHH